MKRYNDFTNRFRIAAWASFDFANTGFSVMIVTFGYALYFQDVVAGGPGKGDLYWGIAVSLSMLITAVISPLLGAAADHSRKKKRYLFSFTVICIIATASMWFVTKGDVMMGMVLFVIANVGFEGGTVFYDAFLPEIASPRSYGRVSGYGYAMGYAGAFVILLLSYPLLAGGFAAENLTNVRLTFPLAAIFFFVFSIPTFLVVRDHVTRGAQGSFISIGITRVKKTLSHIKEHRNVGRFLLAFFVYNDGILTVIAFASLFAKSSLGMSVTELITFYMIIQSSAIAGSIVFGILADSIGPKKTISITLVIWIIVSMGAMLTTSKEMFYVVGMLAGAAIGSSQSTSRSFMARLSPPERVAEFFGFYDGFCGKASAIIGPLLFGIVSNAFGQRIAVASVTFFFIVGLLLLRRVEEPKKYKGL